MNTTKAKYVPFTLNNTFRWAPFDGIIILITIFAAADENASNFNQANFICEILNYFRLCSSIRKFCVWSSVYKCNYCLMTHCTNTCSAQKKNFVSNNLKVSKPYKFGTLAMRNTVLESRTVAKHLGQMVTLYITMLSLSTIQTISGFLKFIYVYIFYVRCYLKPP